ncbi:DUF6180 family protein [Luteimonas aquatica]|uniref:DUF6180 family protein n=1 Tax=Luteimonas aquatica TaxID=450364 RepID=UPI001F5635B8|nr:DUF6180 family protein [Luteimonas aquatica]
MATNAMRKRAGLGIAALLAVPAVAGADDFGLNYAVEREPATRLSVPACAAAVRRGADALGYVTRLEQDHKTLAVHVSGPRGDGRALVAYCIEAGSLTVYVVQALDYSGPGSADSEKAKQRIVAELRRTAAGRK